MVQLRPVKVGPLLFGAENDMMNFKPGIGRILNAAFSLKKRPRVVAREENHRLVCKEGSHKHRKKK